MAAEFNDELEAEVASVMRSPSGPSISERAVQLWLAPMRGQMEIVNAARGKTIGELTVPEALAWFTLLGYAALTGLAIGMAAGNLTLAALGVRR